MSRWNWPWVTSDEMEQARRGAERLREMREDAIELCRQAFFAGWEACHASQTESGPCSDVETRWQEYINPPSEGERL